MLMVYFAELFSLFYFLPCRVALVYYIVVYYHIVCLMFQLTKFLIGAVGAGMAAVIGIGVYRHLNN